MAQLHKTIIKNCPSFIGRLLFPSNFNVEQFLNKAAKEIPANSIVLDAGAGQSQYKDLFENQRYVAIDTAYGDSKWDYSNLDIICDIQNLAIQMNSVDVVICTQVLEHVPEPGMLIKELFKSLKPGGTLYLTAPQGWPVHQAPHDYFRFTCYGLEYLCKIAGFDIEYINPSCGYFGYLANRLASFPKIIFWQVKNPVIRILLSPLEFITYLIFSIMFPLILTSISFIDRKRDFTLNYFLKAIKPEKDI